MDAQSGLVVDSVTGVDIELPVAGPGARSFAFVIDWHIRTILSVAWYVVAAIQHNHSWSVVAPLSPDSAWFVLVVAPPAAIYFLYHPVWEVITRGHTPGKRMAGVQIVSRDGGAPGIGSLLTRNVFRLIDSFPAVYAVGLITTMLTRNHVRIGDLAAGTLLAYVHSDTELIHYSGERPANSSLDATTLEVVSDLLNRWDKLDTGSRRRIARAILTEAPASSSGSLNASASPNADGSPNPDFGANTHSDADTDSDETLKTRLQSMTQERRP
jgi:uncharacterized RDD family membrane protein YckC